RQFAIWAAPYIAALDRSCVSPPPTGALAFSSNRNNSRFQIFTGDKVPLTQRPTPMTTAGAGNQESRRPAWSKNGDIAYQFGAPGARSIHVIQHTNGSDVRVTPLPSSGYPCLDNR